MKLLFRWVDVLKLIDELRYGDEIWQRLDPKHLSLSEMDKEKGLWLCGGHGVYLQTNVAGKSGARKEKSFSLEYDPIDLGFDRFEGKPTSYYWKNPLAEIVGDDTPPLIPLRLIEELLAQAKHPDTNPEFLALEVFHDETLPTLIWPRQ